MHVRSLPAAGAGGSAFAAAAAAFAAAAGSNGVGVGVGVGAAPDFVRRGGSFPRRRKQDAIYGSPDPFGQGQVN